MPFDDRSEKSTPTPPYVPEGEPKSPRFNTRVENPDLFLKAIKQGASGKVGNVLMEFPVENVDAELVSHKSGFDISVGINVNTFSTIGDDSRSVLRNFLVLRGYEDLIKSRYPNPKERGGVFIVTAKNGTTLVIERRLGAGEGLLVTTGRYNESPWGANDKVTQFGTSPIATPEGLNATISDLRDALNYFLGAMYKDANKVVPNEELVLRPPKELINIGGREKNGVFKTPEELLGKIEIVKPNVTFEDIGGNQNAKREIEGLAFALKNPELYQKWGTRPPKGIILYGPPGTGKTLMAKALASQAEAQFFHVEASDIASKWYGESEQIVKAIFRLAQSNTGKTIIFFDEVDAIAPHREGSHEATQRVVSTILENMDGLSSNDNVMVIASTNRLDSIEPALLRAGRFDRWVEVPKPDEEGRRQIFNIHKAKVEKIAGRSLFEGINLDAIIAKTDQSTGADIAEIIRRVLEEKVRQEGTTGVEPSHVTTEDILRELEGYERVINIKRGLGFVPQGKGK